MTALLEQTNKINELIKAGKIQAAQRELQKFDSVPRQSLGLVASLACRASLPEMGIRLLNPIVRPTRKAPATATEQEKIEYAACLTRIGASEEALELLKRLESKDRPEVWRYEAFALVNQWGYKDAITLFTRYIESPKVEGYQRLVGQVNLLSALIYERRHFEAKPLIDELLVATASPELKLLHMSTLHFAAVNAILLKDWTAAELYLKEEEKTVENDDSMEAFLVRKWKAISRVLKEGVSPPTIDALDSVRKEAVTRKHFETLRDCDRFHAFAAGDDELVTHLFFGTPYEGFRRWLLLGYAKSVEIPNEYRWNVKAGSTPLLLDLNAGARSKHAEMIEEGTLLHRLLITLASDFYSPIRLAALFARVYPGEFYHPVTAPQKIHRALSRLRSWSKSCDLPLAVSEENGTYQLSATAPLTLLLPKDRVTSNKIESILKRIRAEFPEREFSAKEVSALLRISCRTVYRVLVDARADGRVEGVGAGPKSKYQFKKAA